MKRSFLAAAVFAWIAWAGPGASGQDAGKPRLDNPFFAFDNGVGRGSLTPQQQAEILADLGYAGIGYSGTRNIPEMLAALDARGLKLFSIYVGASVDPNKPSYDPGLKEAVGQLRGRPTVIWLTLTGAKASTATSDDRAVAIVREVADLAREANLRVAIYPHAGFYVARVEDALRVVQKAERPNLGVSFNLCHWLKSGDEANMHQRLREAMPHLFLVSINGADHEGDWSRLIQTLDRGEFDVCGFLKTLRGMGYLGPVGLQCYKVPGEPRDNLRRSIDAWRGFARRLAQE